MSNQKQVYNGYCSPAKAAVDTAASNGKRNIKKNGVRGRIKRRAGGNLGAVRGSGFVKGIRKRWQVKEKESEADSLVTT